MRFPTDPVASRMMRADGAPLRQRELLVDEAYRSGAWQQIEPHVPPRHPSQLYEALGEGALTGLLLWAVFRWNLRRGVTWGDGAYGSLFLVFYGAVRCVLELFRQPDAQFATRENPLGTVLGPLSMGQVLSLGMVLVGLVCFLRFRGSPPGGASTAPGDATGAG
jgi:phosphatidylglycerol:prolipoprotein diacylglycerol transferase